VIPTVETLRVGRLPFLNARPFHGACWTAEPRWVIASPRHLGALAAHGALDAALLASRDALALGGLYRPLDELGIACHGAVSSVLLLSRRPLDSLAGATIALTTQSRTSRGLLRILLAETLRAPGVRFCERALGADARLLIGDAALAAEKTSRWPHRLDLGAAWSDWTGLPFVYARWVVRRDVPLAAARQLAASLRTSLSAAPELPPQTLPAGISSRDATRYLERFRYRLGPADAAGLERFREELRRHDLLDHHSRQRAQGSAA